MADLGIPALLGALGVIGAGVWKRFFSEEAINKRLRDKRERLEDEYRKLFKTTSPTDSQRKRMSDVIIELRGLSHKLEK